MGACQPKNALINHISLRARSGQTTTYHHPPSLPPTAPAFFAFCVSPEHIVRETLNESDKLFTWTIMSRFWLRGTTISSFRKGTWASVTTVMNSTTGISVNYTLIKRSVLHQTCIGRSIQHFMWPTWRKWSQECKAKTLFKNSSQRTKWGYTM